MDSTNTNNIPERKQSTTSAQFLSVPTSPASEKPIPSAPPVVLTPPPTPPTKPTEDAPNGGGPRVSVCLPPPTPSEGRKVSVVARQRRVSRARSVAPPPPPDGGWGWVVVFAAFISCAGVVGLTRAFGIIYVEILQAFPESSALAASWIPGIYNTLSTGLAPVAGALSNRYSCRKVVFVGGLLMSTGLVLNFFATSVEYLYISFGVITGCGAGMCTTPGIIMVARYFKKRRSLANGLCLAGTSSGAFVQPLLVEYLTNKFGFRGAMLIMGGIMLHICAFSLVYTPLEAPKPRSKLPPPTRRLPRKSNSCAKKYCWLLNCLLDRNACLHKKTKEQKKENVETAMETKAMLPNPKSTNVVEIVPMVVPPPILITRTPDPEQEMDEALEEEFAYDDDEEEMDQQESKSGPPSKLLQVRNMCLDHSINDLHTASAAQVQESIRRRQSSIGSDYRPRRPPPVRGLRRYIDYTLFQNRAFVLFVASSAFTSVGYPHASVFMPAYATSELGISKADSGLLLSVTAGADLVGRIGFGWLADQNLFQRVHGYMFNVFMTAAATLTIPAATTYVTLLINSAFYGLGVGSFFMLIPVILTDHHGAEQVASSYGLVRLFHGIMSVVTPPIAGVIRDSTGQYMGGFLMMGSVMMLGSFVMFFMPAALRYEERKAARRRSLSSPESRTSVHHVETGILANEDAERKLSINTWGRRYSSEPKSDS